MKKNTARLLACKHRMAASLFAAMKRYDKALASLRRALCAIPREDLAFSPPLPVEIANRPAISVIIPTCNRAESLRRCLESLRAQTLPGDAYEIIVVNNGSTDHTMQVCADFASAFPRLKAIQESVPGLLAARHAGWRAAAADILTFCDDDIEALPTWLESIATVFAQHPEADLVGGNNYPSFESHVPSWVNTTWRAHNGIDSNGYFSLIRGIDCRREVSPGLIYGCNFSIRRSRLEYTKGFEPDLMPSMLFQGGGESIQACPGRTPARAMVDPGASVIHHMPASRLTPEYMRRRGVYMMVSTLYTYLRNATPQTPPPMYKNTYASDDPGIRQAHEGKLFAQAAYIKAVIAYPFLREWILQSHYLGHETIPPAANVACMKTIQHHGW